MTGRPAATAALTQTIAGHEVTISNPGKILFPKPKYTKLDLVNYYVTVADGALRGAGGRPNSSSSPWNLGWIFIEARSRRAVVDRGRDTAVPSGGRREVCVTPAHRLARQSRVLELHPHPVARKTSITDGCASISIRCPASVAQVQGGGRARAVLDDVGLAGWQDIRLARWRLRACWWDSTVRRAALALAREVGVEHRLATSKWWKEGRGCSSTDQNAKDRTVASAFPCGHRRASPPSTGRGRSPNLDFAGNDAPALCGNRPAQGERTAGSLDALLELSAREREGQGDAPWPALPQTAR
jgi:DNA primase